MYNDHRIVIIEWHPWYCAGDTISIMGCHFPFCFYGHYTRHFTDRQVR